MKVKKFRTISIYEIGKTESYLSDMAKKGLFLVGMSQSYNIFRISEPADMEYRIEFGEKVLNQEMREMYEMSGWSYVCSIGGIHIFRAAASDTLVEIHTDPEEQSYTLRKSCKMFTRLISFEIVLVLIMIALSIFATMIGGTPVLNLLDSNFINVINSALMLYLIFEIVRQMQTVIQIKKRLQMGFYINHHEPWKRCSAGKFIVYGFLAIFFILCLASIASNIRTIAGDITGGSNYALTLDTELPVVRLNDIEKLESPVIRTYYSKDNNHLLSNVRVRYNVFIKEYEINEEFLQENMTWEGEVYTPSIHTYYYKIYVPFTVQGALSDVLHKAEDYFFIGLPEEEIPIEKLDCNGLDEVYYIPSDVNGENYFGLVVRKGNVILWMIYNGQKTRTEVVEASQKLFE
jgi:hypothetical protein